MNRCPIHDKPLVRTHGGSLICLPCYFAKRRADRTTVIKMTTPTQTVLKNRARAKKHYHDNKQEVEA